MGRAQLKVGDVLPIETMRDNILLMYAKDPGALAKREWYRRANRLVKRLAKVTGRSESTIASVIAVLSPRLYWPNNVRVALALLRDPSATECINYKGNRVRLLGLPLNHYKARMILLTSDLTYVSGRKVIAFRDALLCVNDAAVVDVHATNIAMGTVRLYDSPGRNYSKIAAAYIAAAEHLGCTVAEVQAATWSIYRESA